MLTTTSDEISLAQVWAELFRRKILIIVSGFVCAAVAVAIALSLPNMYTAKVLTVPKTDDQGALGGLASSLGGIAGMAGIKLGKSRGPDKTLIAIEILKSQRFINQFVEKHNLVVPLMAAKASTPNTFELIYDEDIYNTVTKKWVREVKPPKTVEPTPREIYDRFLEVFEVNFDPKDGFVDLSIEFYSPDIAVEWVGLILEDINEEMRQDDISEAQASINYLNETLSKVNNTSIQASFYQLIEDQTNILMLANSRKEYIFKTISPAIVPEKKSKPNRILIVLAGGIIGGFLSVCWILIRFFNRTL
ncbi:Wzz/FepE/Etk N-terminal domain-containing protein [Thalassotalea piscium]|uniref:Uncharacterized protein involved in exopolysaccharide biosynthesis n=1 Tax=Thalassotalea piscium TaxID=1230533 RepID=A0A7X0NG19_9GAMM|nr:Wzz/FepE/Etk N-terminal domain-containing protein [Thalassotalea piscium]MBB6542749.1 uncharacterized protein involved in exopolysaccharide biosynthesis [Thalassotalea piscium]